MIVCCQWWFTPKPVLYDKFGNMAMSLFSQREPAKAGEEPWGTYHEVTAIWKIKNISKI